MAEGGSLDLNFETLPNQAKRLINGLPNFEYQLREYCLSGRTHMTILLCGKTGVGKSHLTNALIGKVLAKEGEDLDPESDEVTPYNFSINGVEITVVDTPGLADGTGNEEEYLQKIKEKVTVFDAFIFCTEMNTHRFRNDDIKTVQKLTEAFGSQLWEHAVVVLTFANEVHPPPSKNDVAVQEFFDQRVRIFRKKIQEVVLNVGVPEGVVINLPLVPAGDLSEPRLPGIDNWLRCFWITTFKRLNRSARPTFFLANITRFDCVSSSQEEIQTLNRSKCMTEPKQRTPPKPRPKPKPKRSGNGQGVTVDAPVSIDLDEPSAKEIIMEIIHEVGKEASKVVGDLIRPGTGRVWSDVFAWVITLVKGWLKENPAKKNDVVEEEGEQEED